MDKLEYNKGLLPLQKVSRASKENAEFKYGSVDAVIASTRAKDSIRRRSPTHKKRNYDLFNNKIDVSHFEYVTNPYNMNKDNSSKFQLPASLQPYDVIYPIFSVLFGEESGRNFNPIVRVVNEDALSTKDEMQKKSVLENLAAYIQDLQQNPQQQQGDPVQITKNITRSIKDMREIKASHLLSHYKKNLRLADIWAKGFKDWIIAGEEFYDVDSVGSGAVMRRVNPLQVWFQIGESSDEIDEADQILEIEWLTVHEIVDRYYEFLTSTQLDELESYYQTGLPGSQMSNPLTIREVDSIYTIQNQENFLDRVAVYKVRWKSYKKHCIFHYIDPQTGEEQQEVVDETFKWNKRNPDQWMEEFWVNEYWEGIRIGEDMYIDELIRPRKHQFRSLDNVSRCKSGYVGNICSAQNSQSTSLMDRIVPWLYLYFILWYDTELALSTNIGKIALLDVSLIPDGWEPEKWMYYARAMRIGFINSLNESNRKAGLSGQNQSTQNKELNLEMGNYIQFNIQLLEQLERKIQNTAGVPPERIGATANNQSVTNAQRNIARSSVVTEDLYRIHDGIKLRCSELLVEIGKDLLKGKSKTLQYVTDDADTVMFNIGVDELSNADYGMYMVDAVKEMGAYEAFKEHVKFALQNDQMAFYQIADIYSSESVSEMRTRLKEFYENSQKSAQQQHQDEIAVQQQELAQQQDNFDRDLELRQYIADTTNETKIQVAEINSYIGQDNMDLDGNGLIDPIEIADQALRIREMDSKAMIEQIKISHDRLKESRTAALKEKELKIKERTESEKLKVERENMKNDLQIARINAKNRASKNKSK
jgi:hypothetical protein